MSCDSKRKKFLDHAAWGSGGQGPSADALEALYERTLATDVLMGLDAGMAAALTLTGATSVETLAASGIRLARHYNLYPNPWPKIGHLARRWHGHAVFPVWRDLGGVVECRSNWRIYIEEMAWALGVLAGQPVAVEDYVTADPQTPFEKKYIASGHGLWRCRVDLG